MSRLIHMSAVAALALTAACANYAALLKPGANELHVAEAGYDAAFEAVEAAGKELGYDHVKPNKAKNFIYLQRGLGYGESTYVTVRFKPNGAATELTFEVKSSKSAKAVVEELVGATQKRVKISS